MLSLAGDGVAWRPFLAFALALAVVAVWLARQSARLVREGRVPPPPVLYANVVGTQTVVVALVGAGAWVANVPWDVFGLVVAPWAIAVGFIAGTLVFGASVLATRLLSRAGVTYSEALRDALEPRTATERATLYLGALPAVALGEELLFRGALVGALAMGLDVSPWIPAVASSALFGYAHSAQGRAGVLVTGILGVVLAGVFVLTDSLLAAVVAHYVVNALEFRIGPRLTER